MKNPLTLILALGLASCGPPKAIIVAQAPVKPEGRAAATPAPRVASHSDDGLRMPDMLDLPDEEQLRSSPGPAGSGNATVITRPPKE